MTDTAKIEAALDAVRPNTTIKLDPSEVRALIEGCKERDSLRAMNDDLFDWLEESGNLDAFQEWLSPRGIDTAKLEAALDADFIAAMNTKATPAFMKALIEGYKRADRLEAAIKTQMEEKHKEKAEAKLWFEKAQQWKADADRLEAALRMVSNSIGDLRNGFAPIVEPTRWVEQLQAFIDQALGEKP